MTERAIDTRARPIRYGATTLLMVVDGDCRLRAAISLTLPTVPALVCARLLVAGDGIQQQVIADYIR